MAWRLLAVSPSPRPAGTLLFGMAAGPEHWHDW